MIRQYKQSDMPEMIRIWNEVVEEGIAFPQEECLDLESGAAFLVLHGKLWDCSQGTGRARKRTRVKKYSSSL